MKLDDLIELWDTLLHASEDNVVVLRDIAEQTMEQLNRLSDLRDVIARVDAALKEDK